MDVDFGDVELGVVVNLATLRAVLKTLSIDGRRWWIASDPQDAVENGYISVGHGDVNCVDRLNTLHFRIPIVPHEPLRRGTDRLLFLFDASSIYPEEPGYYLENALLKQDTIEDLTSFYVPVRRALIARLRVED